MQRALAEHNESAEEAIRVRVGLNAGEPIAADLGNVLGHPLLCQEAGELPRALGVSRDGAG